MHLPAGEWYDFWTNAVQSGGRTVTREVDLATMPIYVRAGAIIPVDPVRQYMDQAVDEPTIVRVYSGADGEFRWYEDDGESQNYLNGRFAWTSITWDDDAGVLAIRRDENAGTFDLSPREIVVEVLPEGATQRVLYDGRRAEVRF